MILSVFGTNSAVFAATQRLISIITEAVIGDAQELYVVSRAQLRDHWHDIRSNPDKTFVLLSNAPSADLTDVFVETKLPVLVCHQDAEDILKYLILDCGFDLATALQNVSNTTVQSAHLTRCSRSLVLDSGRYATSILDLSREIMIFFGIPAEQQQLELVKAALGGEQGSRASFLDFILAQFPKWHSVKSFAGMLSDEDISLIEHVGQDYNFIGDERSQSTFYWPRRCFLDGDIPGHRLVGSKLLVGPARILSYGPYMHLPAGIWHGEMQIELAGCGTDTLALLDVFNGEILGAVSMRWPRNGSFAIDISFEVTESHKPLELRLQLLKGAIEGEVLLVGVRLTRAATPRQIGVRSDSASLAQ
ncbi:MAG: hypothetical protein J0I16_03125 [Rhizobiales bacterium]|nr:hypothetical protein [Hyphomicrobiales bacterium]